MVYILIVSARSDVRENASLDPCRNRTYDCLRPHTRRVQISFCIANLIFIACKDEGIRFFVIVQRVVFRPCVTMLHASRVSSTRVRIDRYDQAYEAV